MFKWLMMCMVWLMCTIESKWTSISEIEYEPKNESAKSTCICGTKEEPHDVEFGPVREIIKMRRIILPFLYGHRRQHNMKILNPNVRLLEIYCVQMLLERFSCNHKIETAILCAYRVWALCVFMLFIFEYNGANMKYVLRWMTLNTCIHMWANEFLSSTASGIVCQATSFKAPKIYGNESIDKALLLICNGYILEAF